MSRITSAAEPDARGTGVAATPALPRDAVEAAEPMPEEGAEAAVPDGRSTRWADHRAARRAELVHVARKAVHRQGPDVSMDEIAAAAATSKSIVYRYFGDKTALQVAVGEAVVAQMHAALDEAARSATTPREGLRSMIDVYLEMVEASPNVYSFVTRPVTEDASGPIGHFLDAVATLIARPFAQVMHVDGDPSWVDVWAAGAVGFVRGTGEWWLNHRDVPGAPTRAELTERTTAWLWAGPVSALRGPARPARPTTDPAPEPIETEEER